MEEEWASASVPALSFLFRGFIYCTANCFFRNNVHDSNKVKVLEYLI